VEEAVTKFEVFILKRSQLASVRHRHAAYFVRQV
jgi:hypothetical protein